MTVLKVKLFYRDNLCGRACAAMFKHYTAFESPKVISLLPAHLYPVGPGSGIVNLGLLDPGDTVVMLGCSPHDVGDFDALIENFELFWIDHDDKALRMFSDSFAHVKPIGVRNTEQSSIRQLFEYTYKNPTNKKKRPLLASSALMRLQFMNDLVRSLDVYERLGNACGRDALRFNNGLLVYDTLPWSGLWDKLFLKSSRQLYGEIVNAGKHVIEYKKYLCAELLKSGKLIEWLDTSVFMVDAPYIMENEVAEHYFKNGRAKVVATYHWEANNRFQSDISASKWMVTLYGRDVTVPIESMVQKFGGRLIRNHPNPVGRFALDNCPVKNLSDDTPEDKPEEENGKTEPVSKKKPKRYRKKVSGENA